MIQIDPQALATGMSAIVFVVFVIGILTGLARSRGPSTTQLENLYMTLLASTKDLIAAVHAAETKLDGYVTIISANTQVMLAARDALKAVADQPTPAAIAEVIDGLEVHLATADNAIGQLITASKPDAQTAPPAQGEGQATQGTIA